VLSAVKITAIPLGVLSACMAHPGSLGRHVDSLAVLAASCEAGRDSIGSAAAMGLDGASRRVDARLADAGCNKVSPSSIGCCARAVALPEVLGELLLAVEPPQAMQAAKVKTKHPTDPRIVSFDMVLVRATRVPRLARVNPRKALERVIVRGSLHARGTLPRYQGVGSP
jgi:hypothetical protein